MMFTRAGYEIWYDPCCTIYHKESRSTGQGSPLRTYYTTRNRLLFVRRNVTGLSQWLSYAYILCIVAPKDIIKYALQGRLDLSKSTLKGIKHFLKDKNR
jgi:hypothetical protein